MPESGGVKLSVFYQEMLIGVIILYIIVILYCYYVDLEMFNAPSHHPPDKSLFKKVLNTSAQGFIMGVFTGSVMNGGHGALAMSVLTGLAAPLAFFINYHIMMDETKN